MLHWRCVHNSCFVLWSKKQEGSSSLVSFWICKAPCQTLLWSLPCTSCNSKTVVSLHYWAPWYHLMALVTNTSWGDNVMLLQEEILLANGGQLPAIGLVLGKFVLHLLMNHLFGCCLDYYEIWSKTWCYTILYTKSVQPFPRPPPSTPIRAMHSWTDHIIIIEFFDCIL